MSHPVMRKLLFIVLAVTPLLLEAADSPARWLSSLPLRFDENTGKEGPDVRYVARAGGLELLLTSNSYVLRLSSAPGAPKISVVTRLSGARARPQIEALDERPGKTNYLLGRTAAAWHTGVRAYGRVRYREVYPGIDLVFHGSAKEFEYDFVLSPGADPRAIRLTAAGAQGISVDPQGNLVLTTASGKLCWKRPLIYQQAGGRRKPVEGRFELEPSGEVGFKVAGYDPAHPLIIDPTLTYSTFLGGTGNDAITAVAVDQAGNVYVTGGTDSLDLPVTPGVLQKYFGGGEPGPQSSDVFIAKFLPSGTLSYLTYLGAAANDTALGIAVDRSGNAYVTGFTMSVNFPVTDGAYQTHHRGQGGNDTWHFGDAFVAKLNAQGNQLLYSTLLGGSQDDAGTAIAIDADGNAYVAGFTLSGDFPAVKAAQARFGGGGGQPLRPDDTAYVTTGDAFVAKLDPSGATLVFSTFLGGTLDDMATSIALDASRNVYAGGFSLSYDFPVTPGAAQTQWGGVDYRPTPLHHGDGFITKLSTAGALIYSTYVGGAGDDAVQALTVDAAGAVYATGMTSSANLPVTASVFQPSYRGPQQPLSLSPFLAGDVFVVKVAPDGSSFGLLTYLGGSGDDYATSIVLDSGGDIWVAGVTNSYDFPVTAQALQPKFGGNVDLMFFSGDGFLAALDASARHLVYSTYIGGSSDDAVLAMAKDPGGNLYLGGVTMSPEFPVTSSALQPVYGGGAKGGTVMGDAFLMKWATGQPVIGGIASAASYAPGVVSPGMLAVLGGANLGPPSLTVEVLDPGTGLVSTTLGGTRFFFNDVPAPVFYASGAQSVAVVPYSLAGAQTATVVAEYQGLRSAPFTVQVADTGPGLFSSDSSGSGQGAIYNQDATRNSSSNPAQPGTIITMFGTGEGQTNPPGVDGKVATLADLPAPAQGVSLTIGGQPADDITYAGAIPFEVAGLFQINARVPAGIGPGNQPVVVTIGNAQSQANLTVAVK